MVRKLGYRRSGKEKEAGSVHDLHVYVQVPSVCQGSVEAGLSVSASD